MAPLAPVCRMLYVSAGVIFFKWRGWMATVRLTTKYQTAGR